MASNELGLLYIYNYGNENDTNFWFCRWIHVFFFHIVWFTWKQELLSATLGVANSRQAWFKKTLTRTSIVQQLDVANSPVCINLNTPSSITITRGWLTNHASLIMYGIDTILVMWNDPNSTRRWSGVAGVEEGCEGPARKREQPFLPSSPSIQSSGVWWAGPRRHGWTLYPWVEGASDRLVVRRREPANSRRVGGASDRLGMRRREPAILVGVGKRFWSGG